MKRLLSLFALILMLLPVLAACSGGQETPAANPDVPVVQVYHPPT